MAETRGRRGTDDAPLAGATFGEAVSRFFGRYATFSGRASRSEYWWVALLQVLLVAVVYGVMVAVAASAYEAIGTTQSPVFVVAVFTPPALLGLYALATLVPSAALTVRRLHDANYSGWLALLALVPVVGLCLVVLLAMPSDGAGARFDAASSSGRRGLT